MPLAVKRTDVAFSGALLDGHVNSHLDASGGAYSCHVRE